MYVFVGMAVLQSLLSYALLLNPLSGILAVLCMVGGYWLYKSQFSTNSPNPFLTDSKKPPVIRHEKDSVIKQGEERCKDHIP